MPTIVSCVHLILSDACGYLCGELGYFMKKLCSTVSVGGHLGSQRGGKHNTWSARMGGSSL